ncbi:hypothetical protein NEIG_01955 [Nematocida sp. ERTm5]|nr:hypothetical protein NEIG_01955 [Nematocida sp. ERTm5]
MKTKGFLSVFQKHLQKEVLSTPEYKNLLRHVLCIKNSLISRYCISPICSRVFKLTKFTANTGATTLNIADVLLEAASTSIIDIMDKTISQPLNILSDIVYKPILHTGRLIYSGQPYKRNIDIKANNLQMKNLPMTQDQAKKLITAVIEGMHYDDLLQEYSPYAWRSIRVGYAPGELLDVNHVEYNRKKKELLFIADMYNEIEDKVHKKKSKWKIKNDKKDGVTVHKVEVSEIL